MPAKVENSAPGVKAELRRWLIGQLGFTRVLDCFAGRGEMWSRVYQQSEFYLGLDMKVSWADTRRMIACDSRRYLRHRDTDLARFNLFDLDAFGSPYEHLAIICSRIKPAARVGFCLTDGLGFNAAVNSNDGGLLAHVGLRRHSRTRTQHELRAEISETSIRKSLAAAGLRIVEARQAEKQKSSVMIMRYIALLCEPQTDASQP